MKTSRLPDRATSRIPTGGTIDCQWCVGTVAPGAAAPWQVMSGSACLRATRAASCLLEPRPGDSVACVRVSPDEVWIVAILQREEGTANVMTCDGGLRIAGGAGGLELEGEHVTLSARTLEVKAAQGRMSMEVAEVVGRQFSLIGTRIKLVGSVLSSVFDRVQHHSRHYLRNTDGTDRVAATHVEVEASQLMRLEGEHALVNGRALVKTRGAQIHFG